MTATAEAAAGARQRVLLLHSPSSSAEGIAEAFERAGYECAGCPIAGEWLEFVGQFQPAVVLLTCDVPATVARGIAQALRRIAAPPRIVALARPSNLESAPTAASLGVDYRLRDDTPSAEVVEYVNQVFRLTQGPSAKRPEPATPSEVSPTEPPRSDRPTHECVADELLIERVRESYKRCERLLKPSEPERRRQARHPYEGRVLLSFLDHRAASEERPATGVVVSVWGRELATYGLGFFCTREAVPIAIHDAARSVPLDHVLKAGAEVCLGLRRGTQSILWLGARVVHFGPTYEGLYVCGVEFVDRGR